MSRHAQKVMTLKARFITMFTNVAVLQFRWKIIPHRWCT